jgi:hypothetical protein
MDAATDTAAIILPIIPVGRHPHLLHKAEATGARLKYDREKRNLMIKY